MYYQSVLRFLVAFSLCVARVADSHAQPPAGSAASCSKPKVPGLLGEDLSCTSAPIASTVVCPLENPPAAWTNSDIRTKVTFNNTFSEEASLFWIDEAGGELFLQKIPIGSTVSHSTKYGHIFRVRSASGRMLLEHKVGLIPIYNDAQVSAPPGADPGDFFQDEVRDIYEMQPHGFTEGWINYAGFPIQLFWYNESGVRDQTVAKLAAQKLTYEFTYSRHDFRAYTMDGRYVATRIADTPIQIPTCPEIPSISTARNQFNEVGTKRVVAPVTYIRNRTCSSQGATTRLPSISKHAIKMENAM